jgi:Domain of unknown function (DUF1998)
MSIRVGEVRPSQLLWTYGPGALIDLPNLSVMTMGLDRWDENRCPPVDEERLLDAVRRVLGSQVQRLRMPPFRMTDEIDPFSAEAKIGVPVRPFPRWMRCVRCGILADVDSGLFEIEENLFRPENTRFVHSMCVTGGKPDAVPARFLLGCRNGHLDDFPWHYFVHQGPSVCMGTLKFYEQGASLQTENLWVQCETCDAARSLAQAFGKEAEKFLPGCRGRHPHLNMFDNSCSEKPRAVLLGSTNSWFSISLSVLAIPLGKNALAQLVNDGWTYFSDVESEADVKSVVKTLIKTASLPGVEAFSAAEIWKAIQAKRNGTLEEAPKEVDIKRPEWWVLTDPSAPTDWPHFLTSSSPVPTSFTNIFDNVLLLERLREVNALIGFTRVEAPEESDDPDERPPMASLTRDDPTWIPASEVHGEGVFIRFNETVVRAWERSTPVINRNTALLKGHQLWRGARRLDPAKGFPGIRYAMLHTFSHLLIRELALECGYNAASIRERIYSDNSDAGPMAGVLFYTAAADSDGTLGGLVELGKPDNLGRMVKEALRRALVCSSDPLCSEHNASNDRTLHNASCHACAFVAETSCERGNRYLDRALLVPTFDCDDAAIFPQELLR